MTTNKQEKKPKNEIENLEDEFAILQNFINENKTTFFSKFNNVDEDDNDEDDDEDEEDVDDLNSVLSKDIVQKAEEQKSDEG